MPEQLWSWFNQPNLKILFIAIATFLLGFGISRFLIKKNKRDHKSLKGDKAFFKGIQYILSNDRDHAIEEFTKSVQINSDTIETYIALGNLYRSKGDIDRAIRIRQTIILRPNIDDQSKIRALIDLGLDYRKGGFLTRALDTFLEVLKKQPANIEALQEVEKIYEELKDWNNAFIIRQKIAKLVEDDHNHILAHQQTEIGKIYFEKNDIVKAKLCFKKAISIHEGCVDAYLHLGDLYFYNKDYKKALDVWKKVVRISPRLTYLAYRRLEMAYSEMKNLKVVEEFLKECAQFNSDAYTRLALARYLYNEKDYDSALKELEMALELDSSFWEARRFIGEIYLEQNRKDEALDAYRSLLTRLNFQYMEFQCGNCGFIPKDLQWQCPQCRKWDTIGFMESKKNKIPEPPNGKQKLMIPESLSETSAEEI